MNRIALDLRHSLRVMRRQIGFTVAAVAILALGIGANTALFSVVNGVLLRPLPYADGDRLYWISEISAEGERGSPNSYDDFADWKESGSFESMAAYAFDNFNLTGEQSPQQVRAARVSDRFFEALGVQPAVGRTFDANEQGPSPAQVAILSGRLWTTQFGADSQVVGRKIELDGRPWTVVGVMPSTFDFPAGWDLWVPLGDLAGKQPRTKKTVWTFGRLRPGVSGRQAQEEMNSVVARLAKQYPVAKPASGVELVSFKERLVGNARPTILLLFGAVAMVLFIVCANLANLLLAKARSREREICLRLAMGASRRQILAQFLIESALLALMGGLLGWLAALWSLDALLVLAPTDLPRFDSIQMDWRVFLYSLTATLASGVLFGLLPAWQAGSSDLASSLKETPGTSSGGRARARRLLAVGQMALAVALLSGAALIARSLWEISTLDPGFSRNVLSMGVVLPPNEYPKAAQRNAFFEQALTRLKGLPDVADAAASNFLPTFGRVFPVKVKAPDSDAPRELEQRIVTTGFFSTLKIPLLAGRDFQAADRSDGLRVALLNKAATDLLWPGQSAIGKELLVAGFSGEMTAHVVVGVVGNVHPGLLTAPPIAELYLPYAQNPWGYMNFVVRGRGGDALQILPAARAALWEIDPRRPFFSESTLGDAVDRLSIAEPRFRTVLLGAFAVLAAILAVTGLYSVIAYAVSGRRREIATRMALGARPHQVLSLVMREGLVLAGAGVLIGIVATVLGGRLLAGMLYGVGVHDPLTLGAVVAGLALAALLATGVPALDAARTEPARVLRRG